MLKEHSNVWSILPLSYLLTLFHSSLSSYLPDPLLVWFLYSQELESWSNLL